MLLCVDMKKCIHMHKKRADNEETDMHQHTNNQHYYL